MTARDTLNEVSNSKVEAIISLARKPSQVFAGEYCGVDFLQKNSPFPSRLDFYPYKMFVHNTYSQ